MEHLANSFSVLELDADDSNIQPLSVPSGTPFYNISCIVAQLFLLGFQNLFLFLILVFVGVSFVNLLC
jgi:hypothetical protein